MIEIDGAYGEGGGQILRTALSLSAITHKSFRIFNIRKNRTPSGLQPQHLMAALSVRRICRGEIQGTELLAQELAFSPGEIIGGKYFFDIGTAGSTILVLQTLLPILLFSNKRSVITVIGGTHLPKSPSYDYFERIFLPAIRRFGVFAKVVLKQSGYYPAGGGEIELTVEPSKLKGNSEWNVDALAHAVIRLGNLPSHIANREKQILMQANIHKIEIYEENSRSPGNSITVWQGFKGVCALGERGKRAEVVATEANEEFKQEAGPIDLHLADQLLLYAALAQGKSCYKTSRHSAHLLTNIYVIAKFLDREVILNNHSITII